MSSNQHYAAQVGYHRIPESATVLVIFRKWLVLITDIRTRGGSEWVYVNYEYKPFSKYFV